MPHTEVVTGTSIVESPVREVKSGDVVVRAKRVLREAIVRLIDENLRQCRVCCFIKTIYIPHTSVLNCPLQHSMVMGVLTLTSPSIPTRSVAFSVASATEVACT